MIKKSRRDLMCVGRHAAKVMRNERSEMEHNRSEMPANIAQQICIPAGCDYTINRQFDVVAFRWNASYRYTYCRHSKRFHFASLNYIFSSYLPTHIKFLTEFHAAAPLSEFQTWNFKKCQFSTEIIKILRRKLTLFSNEEVMRNEFGALRVLCVLRVLRWAS